LATLSKGLFLGGYGNAKKSQSEHTLLFLVVGERRIGIRMRQYQLSKNRYFSYLTL